MFVCLGNSSCRVLVALILLYLCPWELISAFQTQICNPHDFGAVGDGRQLDSNAVSRAIYTCRAGGTVQFAAGRSYHLGETTITGRGIQIVVPPSSTLLASAERSHYGARQDSWYLLHFYRCFGCSLTGGGVIQGPAQLFVDNSTTPPHILNWRDRSCGTRRQCRPRLVGVRESADVVISDVSLRDSAFWTLHIFGSEHVLVRGVMITGDMEFPNNDGIDIDGSRDVTVLHSYIKTADDAVCIKATRSGGRAVRDVLVSNCTLQSRSSAVKLGSETRADMVNITFSHLTVLDSNRGLAIQLRDHGNIRDVAFRHVLVTTRRYPGTWWGGGEPIYVTALPRWLGSHMGSLNNVSFTDIVAAAQGAVVVLAGSPESFLRGVLLRNVRLTLSSLGIVRTNGEALTVQSRALLPHGADVGTPAEGTAAAAASKAAAAETASDDGRLGADVTGARARRRERQAASTVGSVLRNVDAPARCVDGVMHLQVKLDLRPGPYDVRLWLATAPFLVQFTFGLALHNVSIQLQAGMMSGGSGGMETGGSFRVESHDARPGLRGSWGSSGREAVAHVWPLGCFSHQQNSAGVEFSPMRWYQELVPHTVRVQSAELVEMQVMPTAGPLRHVTHL